MVLNINRGGVYTIGFTITNTHLPDKPKTPKTGDNDKTIIYLNIILAMIGILSTIKILKDKKDKN